MHPDSEAFVNAVEQIFQIKTKYLSYMCTYGGVSYDRPRNQSPERSPHKFPRKISST